MRGLEIAGAVLLGLVLLVALKLIGMVIQVAVIGALVGFVLGLVLARLFRRPA